MLKYNIRGIFRKSRGLTTNSIILAGGKGSRFGQDKVLEVIGSSSLLEQVISRVSPLSEKIIIVIAEERFIPDISSPLTVKTVTDIYPGRGPLGGIYTGLAASDSCYNLVIACDMPFVNRDLLRYMLQSAGGYDLVIPKVNGLVEPLHAVYAKSCLPHIEAMIERNVLSVNRLLGAVRTRYITPAEIDRYDPRHISFFNINTKDDLARARLIGMQNADDKR
jgi:molybdenum cofactor guanylyltransferase